ncbi:MAG: flavodoxin-dependent (E)-4-hydroxy-3-methylbut-2-enyl-diphosphate synthase [Ignavibacteria bacterium]|jgi:(E)-4-hydroxy-3-methylbut-2-enyl-diphosphate synthase|nr:flavodoxin-dependent (E)-4-hydroxy-3-methylbut-2-enyl-diphosphate synthase [Ignavibacteria bacterium]
MNFARKKTKEVKVGSITIGGNSPISVQTMTKTKTADIDATVKQIERCCRAGADIVRVTVNDKLAADAISEIVKQCSFIPIVADIHFNHIFAIKSIEAGVAKVRINPGNIGSEDRIKQVLAAAKEHSVPIRIGVNSGSVEKEILEKHGRPSAEALYESAMKHIDICNKFGFDELIIAVKSSNVKLTIDAYRLLSEKVDYPLHLGVTEAGTIESGTIKSSIGIGTLLAEGIGDTIRVSLTAEPEKEVEVGRQILRSLELRQTGVEIISCPTCGRLEVDLFSIVKELEKATKDIQKNIKISVLGCAVNGPGEARESDIGIAAGSTSALLYYKGDLIKKIDEKDIVSEVLRLINK